MKNLKTKHRYEIAEIWTAFEHGSEETYSVLDTTEDYYLAESLTKEDARLIVTALNYFTEC